MIKLKDIAQETEFSINTVSRALRNDMRISEATRSYIQKKAREMGYIPNAVAGSLRSSRTGTIGVISADSANPFFSEVIQGIEEKARKTGHSILLINTEEQAKNERDAIRLLLGRQVDGLVSVPVFRDEENLRLYNALKIPYIFVGRYTDGLKEHSILHGDTEGQRLAVDHILRKGHRNIIYIAGPEHISNTHERLDGLKKAFQEHAINLDTLCIMKSAGHMEDGYARVNQAVRKGMQFTAVVCFNDLLAIGALKSLHEHGLRVPHDVEVVGFDNLAMSQFMFPRLTTIDVPKNQLGQKAIEELVKHIEDPSVPYHTINMTPRLIIRETTKTHGITTV